MFTIPSIGPNQAVQYPNVSNGNIPELPITRQACKSFLTSADASLALSRCTFALNAFLATQQNGTLNSISLVSNLGGPLGSDYIAPSSESGTPSFIYKDLTFQYYQISYDITFQVPLPPNQPGPYNPPTNIVGLQAIGDFGGSGNTIVFKDSAGSYSFAWTN